MSHTRLACVAVAVGLVALSACSTGGNKSAPTTTRRTNEHASVDTKTWPTSASVDQLAADMVQHGATPKRALMLFSARFGPLPGVPAYTGKIDRGAIDASDAITAVYAVWPQLRVAQRGAIKKYLTPDQRIKGPTKAKNPTPDPVIPTTSTPAGATTSTPATTASTTAPPTTVDYRPGSAVIRPVADQASSGGGQQQTPTWDYWSMASAANTLISKEFGQPEIAMWYIDMQYDPQTDHKFAATNTWTDSGELATYGCTIFVYDQSFQGITYAQALSVIVHEMFHCYQNRAAGSSANMVSISKWLAEGMADWVQGYLIPAGTTLGEFQGHWTSYLTSPETPYYQRSYDAVGMYGLLGDIIGQPNVKARLFPAFLAGLHGENSNAIQTLLAGDAYEFFSRWGAEFFGGPGFAWYAHGPGAIPNAHSAPVTTHVSDDDAKFLDSVPHGTAALDRIDTDTSILVVTILTGYGRVTDSSGKVDQNLDSVAPVALCVRHGSCDCPDHSVQKYAKVTDAFAPIDIGLSGGDQTGQAAVVGLSLKDFCRTKDPNAPLDTLHWTSPNGGHGGGADPDQPEEHPNIGLSGGDPHNETFDGASYEAQTVGEFTLTRSTDGTFEVQERTQAMPNSRWNSRIRAVALSDHGHRLEWTLESSKPVMLVDGHPVAGLPGSVGNARISHTTTMVGGIDTVSLADGTTVKVTTFDNSSYDVAITPSKQLRGHLAGLLGNDNGNADDDLADAKGPRTGNAITEEWLNNAFTDQWRVTAADSLFTYPAGKSTKDYTDMDFPYKGAPTDLAAARKACHDAGVTEPKLVKRCVVDFAATSSPLYTLLYGQAQAVDTAKARLTGHGPVAPKRSIHISGTVTKANRIKVQKNLARNLTVKAGDVIQIADPKCNDLFGRVVIYIPARRNLPEVSAAPCQVGRVQFPDAGTYRMTGLIADGTTGHFDFTIRWIRPDRVASAKYGDTLSGNIPGMAEHDVYRFKGVKGDIIQTWGPGCSNPKGMWVGVWDTKNHQLNFGKPCDHNPLVTLPATGTYQLVVNVTDNDFGSYAFVLQKGP